MAQQVNRPIDQIKKRKNEDDESQVPFEKFHEW